MAFSYGWESVCFSKQTSIASVFAAEQSREYHEQNCAAHDTESGMIVVEVIKPFRGNTKELRCPQEIAANEQRGDEPGDQEIDIGQPMETAIPRDNHKNCG